MTTVTVVCLFCFIHIAIRKYDFGAFSLSQPFSRVLYIKQVKEVPGKNAERSDNRNIKMNQQQTIAYSIYHRQSNFLRTSNNLDIHNSYGLSTGWRQKNSDTTPLWFISEQQASICLNRNCCSLSLKRSIDVGFTCQMVHTKIAMEMM